MSDSTLEENIRQLLQDFYEGIAFDIGPEDSNFNVTIPALLSLYQKELESRVHEEVGRILFTLPPEARKQLQPLFDAGLKSLTGEQP